MSSDLRQFVGRPLQDLVDWLSGSEGSRLFQDNSPPQTTLRGAVRTRGWADDSTKAPSAPDPQQFHLPQDLTSVSIPQVTLTKILGQGRQGVVWLGSVDPSGRFVAVKIVSAANGRSTQYAVREALTCSRLNHPNIVRVLHVEQLPELWVIIMEYVCGAYLSRHNVSPDDRRLFGQLADALWGMKELKIVHQDIKPANIIIRDSDGSPVLIDFGLAVDLHAEEWIQPAVQGSPLYMAPEVFSNSKPDPSLDWYSLGVTAFDVLVGFPETTPEPTGAQLVEAKKSGAFDERVRECLTPRIGEWFASWCADLIDPDVHRRWAAIVEAKAWRAGI